MNANALIAMIRMVADACPNSDSEVYVELPDGKFLSITEVFVVDCTVDEDDPTAVIHIK